MSLKSTYLKYKMRSAFQAAKLSAYDASAYCIKEINKFAYIFSFLEPYVGSILKAVLPFNVTKSAAADIINKDYFTSSKESASYTKSTKIDVAKDALLLNKKVEFINAHIKAGEHIIINATKVICQSSTIQAPDIHIIKGVDYNWSKGGCQFIGKVHYDEISHINSLAEHLEL